MPWQKSCKLSGEWKTKAVEEMLAHLKRNAKDLSGVLATLSHDCLFTVETHGVRLTGHAEITGMFSRLWANHVAVLHDGFAFVPSAAAGRIAAQFQVTNTLPGGRKVHKSNCNFFHVRDGVFNQVAVYMAGENTLTGGQ